MGRFSKTTSHKVIIVIHLIPIFLIYCPLKTRLSIPIMSTTYSTQHISLGILLSTKVTKAYDPYRDQTLFFYSHLFLLPKWILLHR